MSLLTSSRLASKVMIATKTVTWNKKSSNTAIAE